MQLGFNWVADKESSLILIYFESRKSIYTQKIGWMPFLIKSLIKMKLIGQVFTFNKGRKEKAAEEVLKGNVWLLLKNLHANAK
jgi:hypothetical protein